MLLFDQDVFRCTLDGTSHGSCANQRVGKREFDEQVTVVSSGMAMCLSISNDEFTTMMIFLQIADPACVHAQQARAQALHWLPRIQLAASHWLKHASYNDSSRACPSLDSRLLSACTMHARSQLRAAACLSGAVLAAAVRCKRRVHKAPHAEPGGHGAPAICTAACLMPLVTTIPLC